MWLADEPQPLGAGDGVKVILEGLSTNKTIGNDGLVAYVWGQVAKSREGNIAGVQ